MNSKFVEKKIEEIYSDAMDFKLFHRFLFFLASVAVGFYFLSPLFFGDNLPNSVLYTTYPPVIIWVVVALPKHFAVIKRDERLRKLYLNPFLSLKCTLKAVKPKDVDADKNSWMLIMYYFSVFAPIICFLILLTFFVLPSISQNVE